MKHLFLWGGAGLLVVGGIIALLSIFTSEDETVLGSDYSKEMPYEGATHVPEGTAVEYRSHPPTSGNHWPDPLLDGIYDTEKPDEAIVHSLEHGRIWISYKPEIGEEVISALKEAVSGQRRIIITPRAANETDIALASWTRLDAFNVSESDVSAELQQRILDFVNRYRDHGPEYVPQMNGKRYE